MFFSFKDTIINKFNASDAQYIQMRTNYLVMWNAIERGCQQSFRYFDFGITNPENRGLIQFKRHWDSEESVLPYYYFPAVRGANTLHQNSFLYNMYTNLNKILPEFTRKIAADVFYKRLG